MKPLHGLLCSLAIAVATPGSGAQEAVQVTYDMVVKQAEERARAPFRSPRLDLPADLRADRLDYDKYRRIGFKHDKALWLPDQLPFRVEFFHPGYLYSEPVRIHEFTSTHVQRVRFVKDFFDYGKLDLQVPAETGYAGFRVASSVDRQGEFPEVASFLGASYFRMLGQGQSYGLSARGLAIDCGETDRPEEFPIFTDWWLGKPQRADESLRLFAILDSVSCTGAYAFVMRPGETTVADVEVTLFLREPAQAVAAASAWKQPRTIGMAPLTSMFWFGEGSTRRFDDYRSEVHDSDGLLVQAEDGAWTWRPLENGPAMRHQRFPLRNPRGFGLMQRDREFDSYQDQFHHYHQAPSAWVVPGGEWREGEIHLVELSTTSEGLDNVVAFWDPADEPRAMTPFRFAYRILWTRETDVILSEERVVGTRTGVDPQDAQRRQFVVDFRGPRLLAVPDATPPEVVVECIPEGTQVSAEIWRNPFARTWRVFVKVTPRSKDPIELRCRLKAGADVVSETWACRWQP